MTQIYIDIDGCLAKFTKAASKLLNIDESTWDSWGCPVGDKEMWAAIDVEGEPFWENLEKYEHFEELVGLSDQFVLLTSPSRHPTCVSGKTKWIQKHFGNDFRRYIICPAPKWHCCRPGDILIDDSDKNIELWNNAGGQGVLWPQLWNKSRDKTKSETLKYVRTIL